MDSKLDLFYKRRSIRKFTADSVPAEIIEGLLKAAMAAPSAHNYQPWHFVVVTEREVLDRLAEVHPYAKMLKHAPLCIVVCGEDVADGRYNLFWSQDCAAAMENILLSATALGLGSVWLGIYPGESARSKTKKAVNLPDHITPFGLAVIGYAEENKEPRTQYDAKRVHYNQW